MKIKESYAILQMYLKNSCVKKMRYLDLEKMGLKSETDLAHISVFGKCENFWCRKREIYFRSKGIFIHLFNR